MFHDGTFGSNDAVYFCVEVMSSLPVITSPCFLQSVLAKVVNGAS